MTKTEQLMQERDDLKAKIASAVEASQAKGSPEREASDLRMMEQKLLAVEQAIAHEAPETSGGSDARPASLAETVDGKLDAALKDSFPGSDAVSFIEAAPVHAGDESLTVVKAGKR